MTTHKPFREVVPPGTNFEFIGKSRLWLTISVLAVLASIAILFVNQSVRGSALNWSIDFKGGTEIVFDFKTAGGTEYAAADSGAVREALKNAGFEGFEVSEYKFGITRDDGSSQIVDGILVRTTDFGALPKKKAAAIASEFSEKFKGEGELKSSWSGDVLYVRGSTLIDEAAASAFFTEKSLEMKPWGVMGERFRTPVEGTSDYQMQFAIWGIDRQYSEALTKGLDGVDAEVLQVYGVGARAGERLRNDGVKSLFYALVLIMLYLVVRFDVRYAPGAAIALLHDAILVVGVFAATWQEVSLTTVAALLTVIGYSVNDSVVIFDRIRENVERLKDKKFARIINISLNETLARTLLTSITLFVVTLMMNLLGTGLVRNFAFAMNIGVVVGVYSSIFIASPVALAIHNRYFSKS